MTDLLATLLATGDEDDYLVAMDLCEQEGLAVDVIPVGISIWGAHSSQSRCRNNHRGEPEWLEGSSCIGYKGGSAGLKSGAIVGTTRLSSIWFRVPGSRGPRWSL